LFSVAEAVIRTSGAWNYIRQSTYIRFVTESDL
jgi:hypothetical protein